MTEPAPALARRAAGVLLHVTALPGGHGVGDLGPPARAWVDWLARAGQGWWQVLPVGPLGSGESPYSARSAFAAEPLLLSLEDLAAEAWLDESDLEGAPTATDRVDFEAVRAFKRPRLARAAARFLARGGAARPEFRAYVEREASWLAPWIAFVAAEGGDAEVEAVLQFWLDAQARRLREHAARGGVALLGDLPLFVDAGAADVLAYPELFRLGAEGRPTVVSGAPPDEYSETGQRWGHPLYAWPAHRRTDFAWWRARFARALTWFDALRIDHFIGLHHAWTIPADAPDARSGSWVRTPGAAILERVRSDHGSLPLLAEDLGSVSEPVHRLRDRFGLPGMRVLQWAYGVEDHHRPEAAPPNSACYTGTHDNDTLVGWFAGLSAGERARVLDGTGGRADTVAADLVRACHASPANLAIVPLQDLLGLGSEARFNTPGTTTGNWTWRARADAVDDALAQRLHTLAASTDRSSSDGIRR